MNALHADVESRIDAYIIGTGAVGSSLIDLISARNAAGTGPLIRVCGIANSRTMLADRSGVKLEDWRSALADGDVSNLRRFMDRVMFPADRNSRLIAIDCSSSEAVASLYLDFFRSGMHVVSASKLANAAEYSRYRQLRLEAASAGLVFRYSANVGAALPVVQSIRAMKDGGDSLVAFSGILSGSLSFCFGLLDEGLAFSEAVRLAIQRGFMESDPRADLTGTDVARKLLIIAREFGAALDLDAVEVQPALPGSFGGSVESFLARLPSIDAEMAQRADDAAAAGKVLRYAGRIENGKCSAGIVAVGQNDPLYPIRNGLNVFAFRTARYTPEPMVIRGYGAGPELTAGAVLADIVHIAAENGRIPSV